MQVRPSLQEVREIAASGKYNVIPLSCELLSDFTTPIETMRILKNVSTHCYLLESAQANETWGRYSFLGFDPKLEITCIDGTLTMGGQSIQTSAPSAVIREVLSHYKSPYMTHLPSFTGGMVGYFSYDYLAYAEPTVRRQVEDAEQFKDVDLMLFDKVIAFDNLRQKIVLIVNMPLTDLEAEYAKAHAELERLAALLQTGAKTSSSPGAFWGPSRPSLTRSASARWSTRPSTTSVRATSSRSCSPIVCRPRLKGAF